MHPEPLKNNTWLETLGRLTPDTTGLDRDALLFQAGQASARPARFWPIVALGLLLMQATTVVWYFSRSPQATVPPVVVVPPAPAEIPEDFKPPPSAGGPREWSYRRAALTGNIEDLPQPLAAGPSVPPQPVLSVLSYSSVLSID